MTPKNRSYTVGDMVRVSAAASPDYKGRSGIITEIGPGEGEYRVEFEDGDTPTTGYLPASCLIDIYRN